MSAITKGCSDGVWWLRWLGALMLAVVCGGAFVGLLARTPGVVVLAAALPAAGWVALVLLFDRHSRGRWAYLAQALAAGAIVAAFAASYANNAAMALATRLVGEHAARWLTPGILAPCIEEAAKAVVLVALMVRFPPAFGGVVDGLVCGALVGVGFAFTENLEYFTMAVVQGGHTALAQSVYVRAVMGGLSHPIFAATTGAGLGLARERPVRAWRAAGIAGFLLATAAHLLWNTLAGPSIAEALCNASSPGAACQPMPRLLDLLLRAPGIAVLGLAPALLIPLTFLLLARRR